MLLLAALACAHPVVEAAAPDDFFQVAAHASQYACFFASSDPITFGAATEGASGPSWLALRRWPSDTSGLAYFGGASRKAPPITGRWTRESDGSAVIVWNNQFTGANYRVRITADSMTGTGILSTDQPAYDSGGAARQHELRWRVSAHRGDCHIRM
ncbi:MAG TPA: hypothetical protein VFL95_06615 [Gemmatimonadales bacterium]|nr:hypothetical protein [Gemmatimonadales bacterium]